MDEKYDKDKIEFAEQQDKLRELFSKFNISLLGKNWLFYLWIIETKCRRKPPTLTNVNQKWYLELIKLRNNKEFMLCYEPFKEVYDYLKNEFGEDFWNNNQHKEFERRYSDGV